MPDRSLTVTARFRSRWSFGQVVLLVAGAWLGLLWACGPQPAALQQYSFQGPTMGTTFTVKVAAEDLTDGQRQEVRGTIEAELENVNAKMSTYLDSSELSRFNQSRDTEPVTLSADTIAVLSEAMRISEATEGAFDVTVRPLVEAWGFGATERHELPSEKELASLRSRLGWHRIKVDELANTMRKLAPAVECDLSAIAKGYAVDRVSMALAKASLGNHMVEVGGEVRTAGHNGAGQPWRIAVERPLSMRREPHRVLALADMAMATSGDYRNFYEKDGLRLSHTIDPRTGRPVSHRLASVTVLDPSCMRADGYATALMVMGEDDGFRFAEAYNLAALFLVREGGEELSEKATPKFQALFGAN